MRALERTAFSTSSPPSAARGTARRDCNRRAWLKSDTSDRSGPSSLPCTDSRTARWARTPALKNTNENFFRPFSARVKNTENPTHRFPSFATRALVAVSPPIPPSTRRIEARRLVASREAPRPRRRRRHRANARPRDRDAHRHRLREVTKAHPPTPSRSAFASRLAPTRTTAPTPRASSSPRPSTASLSPTPTRDARVLDASSRARSDGTSASASRSRRRSRAPSSRATTERPDPAIASRTDRAPRRRRRPPSIVRDDASRENEARARAFTDRRARRARARARDSSE